MMTMTAPQDDAPRPGETLDPPSATASPSPSAAQPGPAPRPFPPRWGRIAVALVGLLALCAALVTLVLGAVGVVSLLIPLACVGVAAVAVAVLRLLAVRSREARVNRAFADAMAPVRAPAPERTDVAPAVHSAPNRPTTLFNAEETAERPLTAMERRTAALAAAGSSVVDVRGQAAPAEAGEASEGTEAAQPAGATAWAPVEVPRPTYVDAAKAERQAPAPLDLPEAPKPSTRTPIKTSEAAARVAAAADTAADSADSADASVGSDPATGRINLDDVLQRRRA
jgi:hypothetical protein